MGLDTDVKGGKMANTGIHEGSCPLRRVNKRLRTVEELNGSNMYNCALPMDQHSTEAKQDKDKAKDAHSREGSRVEGR